MGIIKAVCIAISTYSTLPVPRFSWEGEDMRYALAALPLVGVLGGAALLAWQYISVRLGFGPLLFAAVATALPLAVTGGLHMDGFCDTVDALASHQPRERKLEILKDPHVGAFAVIYCAAYLLLTLGIYTELYRSPALGVVAAGFVLSRALVALCAVTLPNARGGEGMLAAFTDTAQKRVVCIICLIWALAAAALMLCLRLSAGLAGLLLALLGCGLYRHAVALKQFGGATGDTTGFFLQLCELLILAGALC